MRVFIANNAVNETELYAVLEYRAGVPEELKSLQVWGAMVQDACGWLIFISEMLIVQSKGLSHVM